MGAPHLPVAARIPVGGPGDYVLDLACSDGAPLLAVATSGGAVVAVDATTAASGGSSLLLGRHAGPATACVIDQASIITASVDGSVGVWDTRSAGGGPAQR